MATRMSRSLAALTLVACVGAGTTPPVGAERHRGVPRPRNVILVIVDGMGSAQIDLARRMRGGSLFLDALPWQAPGTLDPASLDGITDSAAGATALASGVDTHNGWLGMVPTAAGGTRSVGTVLEAAEARGKATGLVTDSYITDATPAAFAAHTIDRDDRLVVGTQMAGQGIDVVLGGGSTQTATTPLLGLPGVAYVQDAAGLDGYGGRGPLYGFFGGSVLTPNLDRREAGVGGVEPTLPQMTVAALGVLERDPDGFFLMVEAGLVDDAGHARDVAYQGSEMIEADQTLRAIWTWARGRTDTLIVFTADHETGGLDLAPNADVGAIGAQRATIGYMWQKIVAGSSIRYTVARFANETLTDAQVDVVRACHERGIADVLAARWNVAWNATCTDEGQHTASVVPIEAWGRRSGLFAGDGYRNERVGRDLLDLVAV